jgi:hypothetical protein
MTSLLQFRLATSNDDPRILELFQSSFGKEVPLEVWKWFGRDCPTGANRTYVCEDNASGRLAASYSMLPIRLRLNSKTIDASLCTNVNTHPEYRGQGLFTQIGHFALSEERLFNARVSIGMPNKNAYPGHMKVGWQEIFPLPFLVKRYCKMQDHACREVEYFDKRFDEFYSRIAQGFSFIVMKDHRFFNWRVVSRPDKEYTKYVYEDGDQIRGYCVLKHFEDKKCRKAHILDIHADCEEVLHDLLCAAESFACGCDELNCWTTPHNPYKSVFLTRCFYERGSDDKVIMHCNVGEKQCLDNGNWWFCLADNDVY